MKKRVKILILIGLALPAILFLYMTAGYIHRCVSGAYLVGSNGMAHFVGYYMLAAPCLLIFIILVVAIIVIAKRWKTK